MRLITSALIATTMLSATSASARADLNVVTSIKPVHALVAGVMQGVGVPDLIVDGAGSPHNYALKPSQARLLQDADLIFWIGGDLEAFLEKPIMGIAENARTIALVEAHGLNQIPFREGGPFDAHDDHDDHDDHGHGEYDPHVWLDPMNAKALVHEIEEALAETDPGNAATYEANAARMMVRLDNLVAEIDAELAPVKDNGFIVFHDAYQHFETRFGLTAIGSITVSPEVLPGADGVSTLQTKVRDLRATCVFSEPQFQPKLVATITENTNAGTGVLDPLGAAIDNGPELYFSLIRNMASALKDCLSRLG